LIYIFLKKATLILIFYGGNTMPLIKIHICSSEAPANKALLVKSLRDIMIDKLQIDKKIGQVILYETQPQHRAIHADRSNNFVFLEVLLYPGRTPDMKQAFMNELVAAVHKILKLDMNDINCSLIEVPENNWYGSMNHTY
jgi:phenylpyruvate tautomerase PptA (4-oxalocrotonate tautomerase family)